MKLQIFSAVLALTAASPLNLDIAPFGCYETWANDINYLPTGQAQNCSSSASMCFKAISANQNAVVFGCDEFLLCKDMVDGTCKISEAGTTCCCTGRLCNGKENEWKIPSPGSSSSKAPSTSSGPYVPPQSGFQCYQKVSFDPNYQPSDPKLLKTCKDDIHTCYALTTPDNITVFDCDDSHICADVADGYCHHDPAYGTLCCCNGDLCNGQKAFPVIWHTESTTVGTTTSSKSGTVTTPSTPPTSTEKKGVASVTIASAFLSILVHNLM